MIQISFVCISNTIGFKLNIKFKDETGSNADSSENPVVKAIPLIRKKCPELIIACDVSIDQRLCK